MPFRIFIDGEAGTTGLQIFQRLADHAAIELIRLDDANRKSMQARKAAMHDADVAILCLPDAAAIEAVSLLDGATTRVIDASTAHRVADGWTYGFAEMTQGQRNAIKQARFVSNPGCYPTGAIGLLRPLRERELLASDDPIVINALSGYSGGGKSLIAEFEGPNPPKAFIYGTAQNHKHLPELQHYSLLDRSPIFVPSVGDFAQGMVVQIPLQLSALRSRPSRADLHSALEEHYAGCKDIDVLPKDAVQGRIDPQALNGTNRMQLSVLGSSEKYQAVLTAVLDNLGKGASGAAVQNLEIMLGLTP